MKQLSLLLLLLFATTITMYGQVETEEVYFEEPEQAEELKDWSSGWHVGVESLRLINAVGYNIESDDNLNYKKIYDFEAIAYYQSKDIWRPTLRAGYIWFRSNNDWRVRGKKIMSRGAYVKIGIDILTSRREKENHALGVHGVLSYGNEYYTFRAGNDFFGYKEIFYKQDTWVRAIELRYTYTQRFSDKINGQTGASVTLFDWNSEQLLAFHNLPGMNSGRNYFLGVFLHILYKVH